MRSWIIGNSADCDLVVESPLASSRHCQLTQTADGYILSDLGSTNGTYVDGLRIASSTRVTPGNQITLGRTVPMPWPAEVVKYIRIGRGEENDIVLHDARVSSRHARLIVVAGSQTLIEDLGSANGTFLNSPDRRVSAAVPLLETDIVCFGTFTVTAATLLSRSIEVERAAPPPPFLPPAAPASEPVPKRIPERPVIAPGLVNRWSAVLLAKVLVLAVLIVLIFGRQAAVPITPENWSSVGQAIASTTFALALLAIWLGCSVATLELARGRSLSMVEGVDWTKQLLTLGARILVLIALCAVGCALVLAIIYWGSGLRGAWLAMWGVMVMASLVGLFLGLVVNSLSQVWMATPLVLLLCFAPMIALGGRLWPLPELSSPIRVVAAAMPSRWAFEDLLLMEADANRSVPGIGGPPQPAIDIAEPYFPAATERMGPWADATALGSMLLGLVGLVGFISRPSQSDP
jgi:pSer/pThr/pTyr-binding forkhead associated (FHA) protein